MRKLNLDAVKPATSFPTLTAAYLAFAVGAKLDGYISIGWLWILSPIWGLVAIGLLLFVALVLLYIIFWGLSAALGKKGGL